MKVDYDIYSYIVEGLKKGILIPQMVIDKNTYEIIGKKTIRISDNHKDNCVKYKLQLIGKNGKKVLNPDGSYNIRYEDEENLINNYVRISGKKNFKKKINNCFMIQAPETVKVPLNVYASKLITLKKGMWIDITDVKNLKFYSDKTFGIYYEVVKDTTL